MGAVYRARHMKLKKDMALKILPVNKLVRPALTARFEREMEAVGRLNHPNIVQAHDAGEIDGVCYLAMDLIEGRDLSKTVKADGALTVSHACRIVQTVAVALGAAHAAGLVHRDIKPSNLLVDRTGKVYVLDLGLARLDAASSELTAPGSFFGTPDYMAPEQWDDAHDVDGRADLYALGCVLHFLLVGRAPYETEGHKSLLSKMRGHAMAPVPDLRDVRDNIPYGLVDIYHRLMEKDPKDRYSSAAALAEALEPFTNPLTDDTGSEIPDTVDATLPAAGSVFFMGAMAGEARVLTELKIRFRWCPTGQFTMGSTKYESSRKQMEGQVLVTLTQGFWLGETQVTQGQWDKLIQSTPWKGNSHVKDGENFPATFVSYDDAIAFCLMLTEVERRAHRLPTSWSFALPTDAQWEYACRAGSRTRFCFGDDEDLLSEYAWYGQNTSHEPHPQRVGLKKPNAWGLKDMHGNVLEWCADWYDERLPGGVDPTGEPQGMHRVTRGGGWHNGALFCRSAFRDWFNPNSRDNDLGFRLALVHSTGKPR